MAVTVCFFIEHRLRNGPDLRGWHAIRDDFGVSLAAIERARYPETDATRALTKYPSLAAVMVKHAGASFFFLEKETGPNVTDLADFTPPRGDIVYFVGRNSRGFRGMLRGSDAQWINLPGVNLWAVQAVRDLLEYPGIL